MMLITNVILTLTAVAATLIGFILLRLITGRSQKYFSRQQKHLESWTATLRKSTPATRW